MVCSLMNLEQLDRSCSIPSDQCYVLDQLLLAIELNRTDPNDNEIIHSVYIETQRERREGHVTSCNTHCGNRISPRLLGSVPFDTQKACLDEGQVTWNKQSNRIEPELHNVRAFK